VRRRTVAFPYLALGVFLFCWISLPKNLSDRARSLTAASLAPFCKWSLPSFLERSRASSSDEISRLQLENLNLRTQMEEVYEWILSEQRIKEQVELLKMMRQEQKKSSDEYWLSFFQRRAGQLQERLRSHLVAMPAQVIYRDPSSWSSSLWVNVGENDNSAAEHPVIVKNSPVVLGNALVGVVDFVGKNQSRVRLITDSGLSPAVRAVRGGSQNRELSQQIQMLLNRIEKREDLFSSEGEKGRLLSELQSLKAKIGVGWEDGYLAKGELHGSSAPFWRSRSPKLKGVGFNYDFPDAEGPSRELKMGRTFTSSGRSAAIPLLKEGDLLVTSGLDGIFPPGLLVGTVDSIGSLKEGGYAYEIEAEPRVSQLNHLQTLFILPPLHFE
jgi:rod shape-determining protein MreC